MAEALKRWNGSEWVIDATINRIEVGGETQEEYLSITYKKLYSVTFNDLIIGTVS